ncbi:hypothetical protein FIA58_009745 [Flavobacterium jejuense]|uniref:Uncharacterized protein n=1 Tax=Flavobacterium jejuense TaxID=1544455 RepID=A0ABX0IQV2_9FLAO|nr:hypothetical protein [Flavobacterium jejuense]NHN25956.1 hypothetical protein [Flavobacterium jejuense]
MRKLQLFFILFTTTIVLGQEGKDTTEILLSQFKTAMQKDSVSDFFIIKHITYGSVYIFDPKDPNACNLNSTYFELYAFWSKGKQGFIQKFDNCGAFNTIALENSKPIIFYKDNIEEIKKEEVQSYKTKPDSIANNRIYSSISMQSHTPLRYYWFYQGKITFEKGFDMYNLETTETKKNINYKSNNNLALVKLNVICEDIIDVLEGKKRFNRVSIK